MTQNTILSRKCFKEGMQRVEAVFQDKKVTEDFLKVYYERLSFCTDRQFLRAVENILDGEQWFPTIAVFLKCLPAPRIYQPTLQEMVS